MRAAGYTRVSTARQAEEGLSLDAQERRVAERIAGEGWELTEIYVERGVSGRKGDRPALRRLLASLDRIDRLVIPKLDRLGRSNRDLHEIFETLEEHGVELVSIGDHIDTTGAAGKLMRAVLTAIAEFESETIGERVKAVAGGRVESGKHHGRSPFGYRGENGDLSRNEPEAAAVREIFESAAGGVTQREIARRLNAKGIKPQRAKDWTQASIGKTLRNVTYKGEVEINGQTFEGDHEPIVEPELWQKVAALREGATRTPGGPRGRPTVGRHLFVRGLLRCGHCGDTMVTRTAPRERGARETYQCHGRIKHGLESCDMEPIPREAIDAPAFRYFEEVAVDVEGMREQLREQTARRLAESRERLRAARRALREVEAARERLPDQYIAQEIDAVQWARMEEGLKRREEEASLEMQAVEDETAQLAAAAAAPVDGEASKRLAEIKAAIAGEVREAGDLNAVRAALSRLFDYFEVFRIGPDADLAELPADARAVVEAQARETGPDDDAIDAGGWSILPYPTMTTKEELDLPVSVVLKREPLQLAENKGDGSLTT